MTSKPAKTILIVDDDQQVTEFLEKILGNEERIVIHAGTLAEARSVLEKQPVDLMLLDLYLPDGIGIKLLADLKQNSNGQSRATNTIVMTAFGSWETHVKAYNLGAFYYLDKPFKLTQVRTLVDQALTETAVK